MWYWQPGNTPKEHSDQILIPLSLDKLRLARFCAQGLVSFVFSWSGADLALVSEPKCVSFLAFFSLLPLVSGPGYVSFIGSCSRVKVCFFGSGFRAKVGFVHWLWVQGQGGFLWQFFTVYPAVTLMCPTRMSGSFTG